MKTALSPSTRIIFYTDELLALGLCVGLVNNRSEFCSENGDNINDIIFLNNQCKSVRKVIEWPVQYRKQIKIILS